MLRSSNFRLGLLATLLLCALVWRGSFVVGLSAVLLSSLGLFWLLRRSEGSRVWPFSSFVWLALHAVVVAVFGFQTIGHFVGWQEGGSPAIPLEQQRRIQYNGYYLGSDVTNIALISPRDQSSKGASGALFVPPQLASGERVELAIVPGKNAAESVQWRVSATAMARPIRLDGWVVNPNAQWLTPNGNGNHFSIYGRGQSKQIKLSWLGVQTRGSWPARQRDIFRYGQNNCRDKSADCGFEVSLPRMREGQPLGQLLDRIVANASDEDLAQFARLYAGDADIAEQIAPVLIVRAYTPTGGTINSPSPIQGLQNSALGLIGLSEVKSKPRVLLASSTSAHQPLLQYGLGEGAETLALRLPARTRVYDQGAKSRLRAWPLEFGAPQRWAIPTESDYLQTPRAPVAGKQSKSGVLREFLLTSSREYIPLPGYLLEGNGRAHEFFARGQLRGGLESWAVTDGKMARQNDAAPRLGESVALGDAAQGALVSLEPTRAFYAFTGRRAALLLAATLLLYGAVWSLLWRPPGSDESGDVTPSDGAWHLLWVGALLIAMVRLITAYRVSLLPPSDASLYQLSAMFNDSLRQSLWLVFWAPAAVAMARLVTWMLEPQRRLALWLPIGLGALLSALLVYNGARLDAQWPAFVALITVAFTFALMYMRSANTPPGARLFKATLRAKAGEGASFWPTRTVRILQIATRAFIILCALVALFWAFQGFSAPKLIGAFVVLAALAVWFLARDWRFWLISVWLVPTLILVGIDKGFKALPGSPNGLAIVALTFALAVSARLIYLLDRGQLATHWGGEATPNAPSAARGGWGEQRGRSNLAVAFTVGLAMLSLAILGVTLDAGLFITVFPLGFALAFGVWAQRRESGIALIAAPSAVLALAVALLWWLPHSPLAIQTPISNENSAIFYRLAVYSQRESDILLDGDTVRSRPEEVLDKVRRNSQQQWQMLHYAQQGRHRSPGYGGAPLSQQSMTYDTALSDCVFAVLLVSEHGAPGALAILGIYLLIGGACLWGMAALPTLRLYRVLPLALVGAYFVCQALYMAAANLGLTVFTGQNLPLLSLRSGSDALQGLILLAVAAWLISKSAGADATREPVAFRETAQLARAASLFGVLALCGWGAIAWGLRALPMPRSYNVDDAVIARLRDNPPEFAESASASQPISWRWADDARERAILQTGKGVSLLERQYARAFNALSADEQRNRSGVYYLSTANLPGREDAVRINADAFRISSPFARVSPWTGAVLARGPQAPQPTLNALGRTFSLSLNKQPQAIPIEIDFDSNGGASAPQSRRGLSSVVLVAKRGGATLAEISRSAQTGELSVFPGQAQGYGVWIDGQSLKGAATRGGQRRALQPFDILTIERARDGRRVSLIFLGDQAPPLAFSQWRNGRAETFYRQSDVLPWSAAILDVARGQSRAREINLSLDLPLHERLQRRLSGWASKQPDYRNSDQAAPASRQKRLALTLMDAHSGEVLALPCWPLRDPASEEFAQINDPVERERLLFNHNLANHAIGSTLKPITFAAMSSQLWGEFDVSQMRVPLRGGAYDKLAGIPLGKSYQIKGDPLMTMSGAPGALGDNFMVRSRNWPHFLLGALGLAQKPDDWKRVMRPSSASDADLFYGDTPYKMDLRTLDDGALSVGTATQNPRFVPSRTASSMLFQGYRSVADVAYSGSSADLAAFRARETTRYWPALAPAPAKSPTAAEQRNRVYRFNALSTISPDLVRLAPDNLSTMGGDFRSFLLGSGDNRWNNVALSETFARLVTGQKVEATFESRGGQTPNWPAMPAPWGGQTREARAWKNANFVRVLQAVGENPRGTAYKYLHGKTGRYVGLFKTGTVNEDKVRLNSETLMFVVGEYRDGAWVPGRTVAGYLYMQKSTSRNDDDNAVRRATLFPGLLQEITEFLDQRERAN